jgi:hypothetical protein
MSETKKEVKKEVAKGPEPNIAYVGPDGKQLSKINSGMRKSIILPEDQSKPFYHERAGEIISQYRGLYKKVEKIK